MNTDNADARTARSMRAQIAAHESWGRTADRSARTAAARRALDQKFLDEAGGDPKRAAHLKKAHFLRLALKSAESRRLAQSHREAAEEADRELARLLDEATEGL